MEYKELESARKVLTILNENGHEAYMVGGFVRDYLLDVPSKDIDITTSATPDEVSKLFPSHYSKSLKYKTITVRVDNYDFEITTYRVESKYSDHRHPLTKVAKSLKDDVKRRDFTINSICLDKDLNVVDILNGRRDLENKTIKAIGFPNIRFIEDALRMFRAFRFQSRFDFEIDKRTYKSICINYPLVKFLSKERIRDELSKIIEEKYFYKHIDSFLKSNLLRYYPRLNHALVILSIKYEPFNFIELYTLASYYNRCIISHELILSKKEYKLIGDSLKLIKDIVNKSLTEKELIESQKDVLLNSIKICKYIDTYAYDYDDLIKTYDESKLHSISDLDIDGNDIKNALNLKDSPLIKEYLDYLFDNVLNKNVLNKKEDLIKYLKENRLYEK